MTNDIAELGPLPGLLKAGSLYSRLREDSEMFINVLVMQTMTRHQLTRAEAEDAIYSAIRINVNKYLQNKMLRKGYLE